MFLGFVLGVLIISPIVFFYFLIIKGVDRYEPEPWWLLTLCFFWGLLGATTFAIVGNEIGGAAVTVALGGGPNDALAQASTASFVAPLVEESTKGVGLLFVWALSALWLHELDGPLDGAIYGGVIGLGFTLLEDTLYVASATAQGGAVGFTAVLVLRTVLAGLGHASFTAMTGLGVGIASESTSTFVKFIAPIGGWSAAVGLHFLHNFLVSFFGGTGLVAKFLVFWTFDVIFFIVIIVLVLRDRAIVMRGLADEVGKLLHPKELKQTTSLMMLMPTWNFFALIGTQHGYMQTRRKQLDLIELAFLKHRLRRGQKGLDAKVHDLRRRIEAATQRGVFVGSR